MLEKDMNEKQKILSRLPAVDEILKSSHGSVWLDTYPNFYVDIDARISELGRQPYTARKFFIKYQDRILFGTDTPCNAEAYRLYFRFLETDDEYIDPTPAHKLQGRWMIYGLFLPDEVLEKIYNKNALKILGMYEN